MDDAPKSEKDRVWNELKPVLEPLAAGITKLYEQWGSTRTCKMLNELWYPENAGIGLGFVPPEARDKLESLIKQHNLHLYKGNGPLGKAVYFRILNDQQLEFDRLYRLHETISRNVAVRKDAPPPPTKPPIRSAEQIFEEQVARVHGLTPAKRDQPKTRPAEVAAIVDAFNVMVEELSVLEALSILGDAMGYFNLPEMTIRELQRTVDMLRDAEKKG